MSERLHHELNFAFGMQMSCSPVSEHWMRVALSRYSTSACIVTRVRYLQNHVQKWFFPLERLRPWLFLGWLYRGREREHFLRPRNLSKADSSDGGSDDAETQPQPSKRKQTNPFSKYRPINVCPECGKDLLFVSGFRDMLRKHSISGLKGMFLFWKSSWKW